VFCHLLLNVFNIEDKMIVYINTTVLIIGLIVGLIYVNTSKKFKN